jgi:hypothetical protein
MNKTMSMEYLRSLQEHTPEMAHADWPEREEVSHATIDVHMDQLPRELGIEKPVDLRDIRRREPAREKVEKESKEGLG